MTNQEFSLEFDILYNNISSNTAPGLSEYEKSVLLTQAQESLVLEIYNGKFNEDTFESTEEVTDYISEIVVNTTIAPHREDNIEGFLVDLPKDLWLIIYEKVLLIDERLGCMNSKEVLVKPTTHDKLLIAQQNPFRSPNERRVLRVLLEGRANLFSKYNIAEYYLRYIRKPNPIILEDLSNQGVTINGEVKVSECELNPALHRTILTRAVQLGKLIWSSGTN